MPAKPSAGPNWVFFQRAPLLSSEGGRRTPGLSEHLRKSWSGLLLSALKELITGLLASDQRGSEEEDLNNKWFFQITVFILRRKIK